MKKFLAILMAALMVLSCTAGLAETTVAPAREVYAYLTLDRDFIQSYVAGSMGEGSDTIASLVLDLIEKSAVDVVATNGFVTGAVVAGDDDVPLCNFSVVTLEDSVAVTSSLFPNYALRVKAEEVEQLIQQYSNVSLGGQQISPEELEQLLTGLAGSVEGYATDLSAYLETLSEKVEASEDGTHMSLALTTNEAADVIEIIANRMADDEPVKNLLNKMLADQEMTADQFIEQMKASVAQLRAGEAQQLASIDVYNQEDGNVYVEVDLAGKALLTFSTGVTDNGENEVNIYIVTCKEGTEDWQSVYDAVIAGEDTENVVLYISADYGVDENGAEQSFVFVEANTQGQDVIFSALVSTENAGTIDEEIYVNAGIDLGITDDDVAGIVAYSFYTDEYEVPSLEGLTMIDVLSADDETMNALMNDVYTNGLMSVMGNLQTALPEQAAAIMQLLGGGALIDNGQGGEPDGDEGWTCENGHAGNTGNFCTTCGSPRPEEPAKAAYCTNCGAELGENPGNFCPNCGAKLN